MSQDYGLTTEQAETQSHSLMASNHDTMKKDGITIASGQNLSRGTCLGKVTATGKYKKWDSSASDGTQTLAGILGDDVDASSADEKGWMYISGEFNKDALYATYAISTGFYDDGDCFINIKEEV